MVSQSTVLNPSTPKRSLVLLEQDSEINKQSNVFSSPTGVKWWGGRGRGKKEKKEGEKKGREHWSEKDRRNAHVSLLFFLTLLPSSHPLSRLIFFPLECPSPKGTPKKPIGIDSARDVVSWFLWDLRYERPHRGAQGTHQPERLTFFFARKTKQSSYL